MTPKALILTGYGINCDIETQHIFKLAGAGIEELKEAWQRTLRC